MATKTPIVETPTQATPTMEQLLQMFTTMQQQQLAPVPQVAPVPQQVAQVAPVQVAPVPVGYIPTMADFIAAEQAKVEAKAAKELAKAERLASAPLRKQITGADLGGTWVLCAGTSGTLWYECSAPIVIDGHVISKARLYVDGSKSIEAKNAAKIERAAFVAWKKATTK